MAARLRRAISSVLVTLFFTSGILALSLETADAAIQTTDASCLVINASNELVSADFCLGDVVIPASVRTIKSNAFVVFKGAVSFEANSQLQTIERLAFHGGGGTDFRPPFCMDYGDCEGLIYLDRKSVV